MSLGYGRAICLRYMWTESRKRCSVLFCHILTLFLGCLVRRAWDRSLSQKTPSKATSCKLTTPCQFQSAVWNQLLWSFRAATFEVGISILIYLFIHHSWSSSAARDLRAKFSLIFLVVICCDRNFESYIQSEVDLKRESVQHGMLFGPVVRASHLLVTFVTPWKQL